jgi:hypothetical protein
VDEGLLRLAQLQVGQKVSMPKRPVQILRPGEETKKPPNVYSIAEFGAMAGGPQNEGGDS